MYALLQLISHPIWFVALSGLCFFAWGNIYSLFPSITGDLYGNKWATTNYGIVYTAKGVAAGFAGPGAAWLFAKTGSWTKVFWAMIICDLIAAFMALLWLKPLAAKVVAESNKGLQQTVNLQPPVKAQGGSIEIFCRFIRGISERTGIFCFTLSAVTPTQDRDSPES